MSEKKKTTIDLEDLSPKALEELERFRKFSGSRDYERTIEEVVFAMTELLQSIDTEINPLLQPEETRRQMDVIHGILRRFKRFEER
jgi:hypothetical protein